MEDDWGECDSMYACMCGNVAEIRPNGFALQISMVFANYIFFDN